MLEPWPGNFHSLGIIRPGSENGQGPHKRIPAVACPHFLTSGRPVISSH